MAVRYSTLRRLGDETRAELADPRPAVEEDIFDGQRCPPPRPALQILLPNDYKDVLASLKGGCGERAPVVQLLDFAQHGPDSMRQRLEAPAQQILFAASAIQSKLTQFGDRAVAPTCLIQGRLVEEKVRALAPLASAIVVAGPMSNGALDDRPLLFEFTKGADGALTLTLIDPGQIQAEGVELPLERGSKINVERMRRVLLGLASCGAYEELRAEIVREANAEALAEMALRYFGDDCRLRFQRIRTVHRFRLAPEADLEVAFQDIIRGSYLEKDVQTARRRTCTGLALLLKDAEPVLMSDREAFQQPQSKTNFTEKMILTLIKLHVPPEERKAWKTEWLDRRLGPRLEHSQSLRRKMGRAAAQRYDDRRKQQRAAIASTSCLAQDGSELTLREVINGGLRVASDAEAWERRSAERRRLRARLDEIPSGHPDLEAVDNEIEILQRRYEALQAKRRAEPKEEPMPAADAFWPKAVVPWHELPQADQADQAERTDRLEGKKNASKTARDLSKDQEVRSEPERKPEVRAVPKQPKALPSPSSDQAGAARSARLIVRPLAAEWILPTLSPGQSYRRVLQLPSRLCDMELFGKVFSRGAPSQSGVVSWYPADAAGLPADLHLSCSPRDVEDGVFHLTVQRKRVTFSVADGVYAGAEKQRHPHEMRQDAFQRHASRQAIEDIAKDFSRSFPQLVAHLHR